MKDSQFTGEMGVHLCRCCDQKESRRIPKRPQRSRRHQAARRNIDRNASISETTSSPSISATTTSTARDDSACEPSGTSYTDDDDDDFTQSGVSSDAGMRETLCSRNARRDPSLSSRDSGLVSEDEVEDDTSTATRLTDPDKCMKGNGNSCVDRNSEPFPSREEQHPYPVAADLSSCSSADHSAPISEISEADPIVTATDVVELEERVDLCDDLDVVPDIVVRSDQLPSKECFYQLIQSCWERAACTAPHAFVKDMMLRHPTQRGVSGEQFQALQHRRSTYSQCATTAAASPLCVRCAHCNGCQHHVHRCNTAPFHHGVCIGNVMPCTLEASITFFNDHVVPYFDDNDAQRECSAGDTYFHVQTVISQSKRVWIRAADIVCIAARFAPDWVLHIESFVAHHVAATEEAVRLFFSEDFAGGVPFLRIAHNRQHPKLIIGVQQSRRSAELNNSCVLHQPISTQMMDHWSQAQNVLVLLCLSVSASIATQLTPCIALR